MMGIGFPELMIILVIIMIIFGAGKLPEIGSAFGRSIKNFKTSMKEAQEEGATEQAEGQAASGEEGAPQEELQEGEGKELSKEEQEKLAREKLQAELDERDQKRQSEADAFTASLPKKGAYDFAKDQEDKKA